MTILPDMTASGINWALNPSMEQGTYSIVSNAVGGVTTSFRDRSTDYAWAGNWSYQVTIASAASTAGYVYINWGESAATNPAVTPGQRWAMAIRYLSTHPDLAARVRVDICNAAYANIGSIEGPAIVYGADLSSGWQTIRWPEIVMPANAAYLRVQVQVNLRTTSVIGQSVYIDGMHISPADTGVLDYVDGDQGPGYGWTGTAGQSASYRNAMPTQGPTGSGGELIYRTRYYRSDITNTLGDEISDRILTGTIDTDIDRSVQSTIKLTALDADAVAAWSWIAVFVETVDEEGVVESVQRGLFQLSQPQISGDEASATVSVTGFDVGILIDRYRFVDTYNVGTGVNVVTAITALLALAGITRVAIPATTRNTGKKRSYKPGDKLSDALVSLTKAMGWYSVYGLPDGRVGTREYRGTDKTNPTRTYTIGERSQLVGPIVSERNADGFANVVLAIRDNPTLGLMASVPARNDDPRSPGSTTYPGGPGVIQRIITVNEDIDQAALDRTAREGLASANVLASGTLQTMPDLTLDVHDVIRINVDPTLYPHLAQANGNWYAQQITQGLAAANAVTTIKIRRSETL